MNTHKQSRSSLWVGVAVLALTSAVAAQFQGAGSAVMSGASQSSVRADTSSSPSHSDDQQLMLPWHELGAALPGILGAPKFKGMGLIAPGHRAELILTGAAPDALAVIFVSLDAAPTSFKGGTLVPAAPSFTMVLTTSDTGSIYISVPSWANIPAGLNLVMQYAILDEAAVQGVALSNALQASTH